MFTMREYQSDETYDLAKFINFEDDVYDVINCPFLLKLKELPTVQYYKISDGYKDIDMISQDAYDTPFFTFFIQYYNDTDKIVFDEDEQLNLFSSEDLLDLFYKMNAGEI
jgi:hypothetical protein